MRDGFGTELVDGGNMWFGTWKEGKKCGTGVRYDLELGNQVDTCSLLKYTTPMC